MSLDLIDFLLGFNSLVLFQRLTPIGRCRVEQSLGLPDPQLSPRTLRPVLNHFCTQNHPWPHGDMQKSAIGACPPPGFHLLPLLIVFLVITPFSLRAFKFNAVTWVESLLYTRPCVGSRDTEMNKNKSLPSESLKSNGKADT